ncbi:facilitated trehalose transporter Tret1-like [Macrobrachium rosenbergii]|uniref:facilitated trehalose transporter Tret1-like n=1 Tax=Macrobrachium rosenbergii TaxID=79674 RepID=UPI0034D4F86F
MKIECKNNGEEKGEASTIRQVSVGLVVTSSTLMVGMNVAWPCILPKMQSDPEGIHITEQDISWLVSLSGIVGMFTSLVTGPLMEHMGPRRLLLLILLPVFFLWLLLAFAPNLSLIYVSRVGLSASMYAISTFIPLYVAELSQAEIRGAIASLTIITSCVGMLTTYATAHFLHWKLATALCAAPFLPLFLLTLFVPESPYWLVRKGMKDEARSSLLKLLGPRADVDRALRDIPNVRKDQVSLLGQIKLLKRKEYGKPVGLVLAIFLLRELSGHNTIFFYSVFIFQRAGVGVDAFLCSVLVGCVRLIFSGVSVAIIDRAGRRACFIGTTVTCFLAEMTSGAFLLCDVTGASWVPVVGVLVYVASYGMGQGSIPWILLGELLPIPVRSVGASIIVFLNCLLLFGVNFVFLMAMNILSVGGILCLFSLSNVVLAVISYVWLPETRGRLLKELENICIENAEDLVVPDHAAERGAYKNEGMEDDVMKTRL